MAVAYGAKFPICSIDDNSSGWIIYANKIDGKWFKECYEFQSFFLKLTIKTWKLLALLNFLFMFVKVFKKFMLLPECVFQF